MTLSILALFIGLALLFWSADRFVEGSACVAKHMHVPPLLVGMVVIGFGTSAPEMVVSSLAAFQGNPGITFGNAFGSNIANFTLILGTAAVIWPIRVHSSVIRRELPLLAVATGLVLVLAWNGQVTRAEALIMLSCFALFMGWSAFQAQASSKDPLLSDITKQVDAFQMSRGRAFSWALVGLTFLIISSRILVWGAVRVAAGFGVSELVIGLTIVAVGTSLPELASTISAARKGEHDLAIGNVVGSNLFNTLAVVGLAAMIQPLQIDSALIRRDMLVMTAITLSVFVLGVGIRGPGRINRFEGAFLLGSFVAYTTFLLLSA